jgi:organic hydroperoxide reductase OsmC/OhrA
MSKPEETTVGFEVVGDNRFQIDYNSALLADHVMDYANASAEQRAGQMRRLLCAAAVGCYAETVYTALTRRGAQVRSLTASGTATTARSKDAMRAIQSIDIRVEVEVDDRDLAVLERVITILHQGCLVTRSIAPCIDVTHAIVRVGSADER